MGSRMLPGAQSFPFSSLQTQRVAGGASRLEHTDFLLECVIVLMVRRGM